MNQNSSVKTGLFILVGILLLAYATIQVSSKSLFSGGTYPVFVSIKSASGINHKTPVEIAGIQVGTVTGISLQSDNTAKLELAIKDKVKLSKNVEVRLKASGFLGDTYLELYQPGEVTEPLAQGDMIHQVSAGGDMNSLTAQLSDIATDVKAITTTMRHLMAGEDSALSKSLKNIEQITESLKNVTVKNETQINELITNMRLLAVNMNQLVERNSGNVDATLDNIQLITNKIKNGEGTVGRLVNDDSTVDKLNDSLDGVNDLLGGVNKTQFDIGYHAEYMARSGDFKNYIELAIKPRPDKFFLLELLNDPSPNPTRVLKETDVTVNGVTSSIREEVRTTQKDKLRFSAQLAKKFYDFTLRGGLIESSGGVGVDYNRGPVGLKFSAFHFQTDEGQAPHLKATGTFNVTKNLYLLGGVDDMISKQDERDWFVGAGFMMTDDDVKSLVGLAGMTR